MKKLNWKLRLFWAPINSQSAASLMLRARLRWQSKSQERLLDHEFSRSISFLFSKDSSQRLMWALMMYRYYITKVRHWKDVLEGHTLFCLILLFFFFAKDVCTINVASPGSLSNFRTRLSLSEILSDLIRCRLVRYPWFCSVRPRSWYTSAILKHVNPYWSKFPSQSEASIWFLFRDQVCFSTSLLNLMYLSIFVRVAKNLALCPRFMLSIQHVSIVVQNLWKKCIRYFYSQCAFNNRQ